MIGYVLRNLVAEVVGLALRFTDWRFSKDYRHGTTRWYRLVYAICNTVRANDRADRIWFPLW